MISKANISYYLNPRGSEPHGKGNEKLELFKSLLQPHFLFNSLNNLYALSLRQADRTSDAIAGLSNLLERVVSFSQRDLIPLNEEVALVEDYVNLEKIWLGEDAFAIDFQVRGDTSSVLVPPLAIYTLIENAFKHGVRKSGKEGWITINLLVKPDKILLNVRNSITHQPIQFSTVKAEPSTGLGIAAVKKLLEGSYKKSYFLDARSLGNVFAVDLIIGRDAA